MARRLRRRSVARARKDQGMEDNERLRKLVIAIACASLTAACFSAEREHLDRPDTGVASDVTTTEIASANVDAPIDAPATDDGSTCVVAPVWTSEDSDGFTLWFGQLPLGQVCTG